MTPQCMKIRAFSAARGAMGFKDDGEGQDLKWVSFAIEVLGWFLSGYIEDAKFGR